MSRTCENKRPGAMSRYCPQRAVRVPAGVRVRSIGKLGGCEVWIVNGELIRDTIDADFTMGGTDGRYSYIPTLEVWLDQNLSLHDRRATLLHEAVERDLMVGRGWTYNRAHDRATDLEREFRKQTRRRQVRYR